MRSGILSGIALTLVCGPLAACSTPAQVSDRWAVVAGRSGGAFVERGRPTEGAPLFDSAGRKYECIDDLELERVLGPVCDHESENKPPPRPVDDLEPGIPAPTPEVRWYCAGKIAVRVVLERCDARGAGNLDGVRPLEVGVATQ